MDISNMDTEYQGDIEFNESSEVQIVTYRTLINLVKANPALYEKHHKGYNKRSDKLLMWGGGESYWNFIDTTNDR